MVLSCCNLFVEDASKEMLTAGLDNYLENLDLCDNSARKKQEIQAAAPGVEVDHSNCFERPVVVIHRCQRDYRSMCLY